MQQQQQHFHTGEPSTLDLDHRSSHLFDIQFSHNGHSNPDVTTENHLANLVEFAQSHSANNNGQALQFINKRNNDSVVDEHGGHHQHHHPDPEALAEISRAFSIEPSQGNTSPSQSSFQMSTPDLN